MKKTKKIDIALLIGLILTIIISSISSFAKDVDGISDRVLRLHILANSDSDEDQTLKLKVRDEILAETGELFLEAHTRSEVEQIALDNIDNIESIASKVISQNGYNYSVKCQLVNMEFDERKYQNITLPAGKYDALRVTIGEAKGHNWWCVMYPQFCIAPAIDKTSLYTPDDVKFNIIPKNDENANVSDNDKTLADKPEAEEKCKVKDNSEIMALNKESDEEKLKAFENSQIKIMKQPQQYRVRFKIVEWFKKVTGNS